MSMMDHNQQKLRQQQMFQQQQQEQQKRRNSSHYDQCSLMNQSTSAILTMTNGACVHSLPLKSKSSSALVIPTSPLLAQVPPSPDAIIIGGNVCVNMKTSMENGDYHRQSDRSLSKMKSPTMDKVNSFEIIEEEPDADSCSDDNDDHTDGSDQQQKENTATLTDDDTDNPSISLFSNPDVRSSIRKLSLDQNSFSSSSNDSGSKIQSSNDEKPLLKTQQPSRLVKIPWSPQPQAPKVHLQVVNKIFSPPPPPSQPVIGVSQQKRHSILSWTRKRAQRFMSTFGQSLDQSIQTVQSFLSPPPEVVSRKINNHTTNTGISNNRVTSKTLNATSSSSSSSSSYYRNLNYHLQLQQQQQQQRQQQRYVPKGDPFWYHKSYFNNSNQTNDDLLNNHTINNQSHGFNGKTQQSTTSQVHYPQMTHRTNHHYQLNGHHQHQNQQSLHNQQLHYHHPHQHQQIAQQPMIKNLSQNLDHFYYVYENGYIKKIMVCVSSVSLF